MTKAKDKTEDYASIVNNNAILLSFEGWVKFVEGFTKGISSTKTVESKLVLDCIGEILEYMQTLRKNLSSLLSYCETVLEKQEILEAENDKLKELIQAKLEDKHGKDM